VRQIGTAAGVTLVVAAHLSLAGPRDSPSPDLPSSDTAVATTGALVATILLTGLVLTYLLTTGSRCGTDRSEPVTEPERARATRSD